MTDVEATTYFDTEYRGSTIWAGLLLMPALMSIGWPLYFLNYVQEGVSSNADLRATWN